MPKAVCLRSRGLPLCGAGIYATVPLGSVCGSTIPEADLPHVFDRFYRSDKSRKSESGSFGLGLAITKEMAEKLGGEISVASTAEAGTVLQVIFSL